jgi:prepilin-type N-terminal cleavage/methylation domain-containing protein
MKTSVALRRPRGVSLIEALVALAIMAIGMLGIVGVQSTLRSTSDVAKQRSEAVRLAQWEIERWRGFITLTGGPVGTNYVDLPAGTFTEVLVGTNASYTRTRTVSLLPDPRKGKSMLVSVTWADRSGEQQRVDLSTLIAGISPELGAAFAVPGAGDVIQQPLGRKGGIPLGAKDLGGGRSGWIPPGSGTGVVWIFNNVTGVITVCTTTAATTADLIYDPGTPGSNNVVCSNTDPALYVSGYVRYALDTVQPTPANAVNPPSRPSDPPSANQVTVAVEYLFSGTPTTQACYVRHVNPASAFAPAYTEFNCAVPVLVIPFVPLSWSGFLKFDAAGLISTSASDAASTRMKVCRYHAAATYSTQKDPLANQNFLMIRSGDGAPTMPTPYTCPTPLFAHQPL